MGNVKETVTAQVERLQRGYKRDHADAVAALAQLRRGLGRNPGDIPSLMKWTHAGLDLSEQQIRQDEITDSEWATHNALTLYALHQQSERAKDMHVRSVGFGDAVGKLSLIRGADGDSDGVIRRFDSLATAGDQTGVVYHARALIKLLRAHDIPFDYGLFARDLELLSDPQHAKQVRLRWGREFVRVSPGQTGEEETKTTE